MNTELHPAAAQYVGLLNGETLCCHTGVIQAAMKKNTKRVHRLVVLPAFQGVGIGTNFIDFVANLYGMGGVKFNLITTTPAIRYSLIDNPNWTLKRSGYVQKPGDVEHLKSSNYNLGHLTRSFSCNRITYSFDWNDVKEIEPKPEAAAPEKEPEAIQLTLF